MARADKFMDVGALRASRSTAFSIAAPTAAAGGAADAAAQPSSRGGEADEKDDEEEEEEERPSGDARLAWLLWLARRGTRAAVAALRLAVVLRVDEGAVRTAVVPMLYQLGARASPLWHCQAALADRARAEEDQLAEEILSMMSDKCGRAACSARSAPAT